MTQKKQKGVSREINGVEINKSCEISYQFMTNIIKTTHPFLKLLPFFALQMKQNNFKIMNIETKTKRKFVWIVGLACLFGVLVVTSAQAQVKVGTNPTTIDARSILELESDNQALYLPRLTTTELGAVTGWQEGMVVYNTTDDCIQIFNGTTWNCVDTDNDGIYSGTGTVPTSTIATITDNLDFVTGAVDGFAVDGTTFSVDGLNDRVGVGTAAPEADFHVRGSGSSILGVSDIALPTTGDEVGNVIFKFGNTDWAQSIVNYNAEGKGLRVYNAGTSSGNTAFEVLRSSSSRLIVDGLGNVGVGTATPGANLHVAGSFRLNGTYIDAIGSVGTSGQVLSSTAAGTEWIDYNPEPNGAAVSYRVTRVAGHHIVNANDHMIFNVITTATNVEITLPDPTVNEGRVLKIINTNTLAGGTVSFVGSFLPQGTITQLNPESSGELASDGFNWYWYSSF